MQQYSETEAKLSKESREIRNQDRNFQTDQNTGKNLKRNQDKKFSRDNTHFHFVLKDVRPLLHNQINVTKSNILDFRFGRQQSYQGRRQLLAERRTEFRIPRQDFHHLHENFHGRKHDSRVSVCQSRGDPLADALSLPLVFRAVVR